MKTETSFALFPTAVDAPATGASNSGVTDRSTLPGALPIATPGPQRHAQPHSKGREPKPHNGQGASGGPVPLLTVEEFAAQLRLTPACVRKWILCRRVAVVKIGRLVRLPSSELLRIIDEGSRPRAETC